ncbi:MAG: exopolysaccharide biosynthesis polyprenyl glycosylphosphotransferase [Candidatus Binatia bacterium]
MGAGELTLGADVRALPHVRTRDPGARVRFRWPRARRRRVLLVGAPDDVRALREQIASGGGAGFELAGALRAAASRAARPSPHAADRIRWLGALPDLARVTRVHRVDEVVVVPGEAGSGRLLDAVLRATSRAFRIRVSVVPSVYELRIGRVAARHLGDVPLIDVARAPAASFRVKHVLDHLLATALLVIALPLLLLPAALAVRLTSRGPVLFRQRRVGRDGHEFVIYKLRTMHDDAERATGPVLAHDGDERVTPVGRLLRATRVDEIPQLLNVLNGTMSLVGPRPERPEFADVLAREIPGYRERWLVRPGITGLAQVRGEYHTSPAGKLRHDLAYVHNPSLGLDLRILAATVRTLAARRGV